MTDQLPPNDPRLNPLYKPHGPRDYSRSPRKTSPKPRNRSLKLSEEQRQKLRDRMLNGLRDKMQEARRKKAEAGLCSMGRIKGAPDGIRYKDFLKQKEHVETVLVPKVMKAMADKKIWEADNDKAQAAMEAAVGIVNMQGDIRTKLQAAKVILEFTQRKPVASQDITVLNAQSFLQAVLDEEKNDSTEPGVDSTP